jgi:hypothetical protein
MIYLLTQCVYLFTYTCVHLFTSTVYVYPPRPLNKYSLGRLYFICNQEEMFLINRRTNNFAWIRKYFKDASEVKICLLFDIIGINDSKLISNPIHALNQEFDETVINIPSRRVIKKSIFHLFTHFYVSANTYDCEPVRIPFSPDRPLFLPFDICWSASISTRFSAFLHSNSCYVRMLFCEWIIIFAHKTSLSHILISKLELENQGLRL